MTLTVQIVMGLLLFLSLFTLARILIGPTIWDRILGFNLFSAKFIMLILLYSALREDTYFIDLAFIYVLLGFISIVFITRFIQGKGQI